MGLAQHLHTWSADQLAELFETRPDLLSASDRGLDAVARKATTAISLSRALVRADVGMIVVAESLVVASPATVDEVAELLGTADTGAVLDAADRLRRAGLVLNDRGLLHPVDGMTELLHRPLGLGRAFHELAPGLDDELLAELARRTGADGSAKASPTIRAIGRRLAQPAVVASLLADAPPEATELFASIVEARSASVSLPPGFPYRDPDPSDPVGWLVGRGLLIPVTDGAAEAPREIIIGSLPDGLAPSAMVARPTLEPVAGLGVEVIAGDCAAGAGRALDGTESLLRRIERGEVSVRKTGGVGPRELTRLSKLHGLPKEDLTRLLELLAEARLVRLHDGALQPTELAARWWTLDRPSRWLVLVRAWLSSERFLSRGLAADDRAATGPVALGDGEPVAAADQARTIVLRALTSLPEGTAFEPYELATVAVWQGPNLWGAGEPPPELLVDWVLGEAELLGLVAHRAPSPTLTSVIGPDQQVSDAAARRALADDQETLVLQSDLTAVAFGPLAPAVARSLDEMAERTGRGESTPMHRFTERSLRSALDRGWTVDVIRSFLAEHALAGLPQPLDYLLDDVARRYGSVRVMPAASVIIADDEVLCVEIASSRRAARIGLRLVAPTVLTCPLDPVTVVEELRAEGFFPVLDGSTLKVDAGGPESGQPDASEAGQAEGGLPADWTGPPIQQGPVAEEITDAVAMLLAQRDDAGAPDQPNPGGPMAARLQRSWLRPVAVELADGGTGRVTGTVVGLGDTLSLLVADGIAEIPLDEIESVDDLGLDQP